MQHNKLEDLGPLTKLSRQGFVLETVKDAIANPIGLCRLCICDNDITRYFCYRDKKDDQFLLPPQVPFTYKVT
jgi:hypothetical protein